jgi:hypothetical protein
VDRPISHSRPTPNLDLTPGQPPSSARFGTDWWAAEIQTRDLLSPSYCRTRTWSTTDEVLPTYWHRTDSAHTPPGVMLHTTSWFEITSKVTPAASRIGRCAIISWSDGVACAWSSVSHTLTWLHLAGRRVGRADPTIEQVQARLSVVLCRAGARHARMNGRGHAMMGTGTPDDPWRLKTPPGTSAYTIYRDDSVEPATMTSFCPQLEMSTFLRTRREIVNRDIGADGADQDV